MTTVFHIFAHLWALSLLVKISAETCDLACLHEAPCVNEMVTFEDEHGINPDGSLPDGFDPGNGESMHCACPHGWTGQLCEVKFKTCDGSHKCYHGGQCMPGMQDEFGNEQLFCDCTEAIDAEGNTYVGKFCEHKAVLFCSGQKGDFCVNGGTCNADYPEAGDPCICQDGFTGPHCQYIEDDTMVPDCPLDCENGGLCTLGDQPTYFEDEVSHAYCQCPDHYTGAFCELKKEPCGNDYCLHGGTCVDRFVNGEVKFSCDCSEAGDGIDSYGGRYCQFKAERYCPNASDADGPFFCTNGGFCKDASHKGCSCPEGFSGFSCEFVSGPIPVEGDEGAGDGNPEPPLMPTDPSEYTSCNLVCENEGFCRKGVKDVGFLEPYTENVSHLNETHNEDFEHCVCPEGYTGLTCDHKVEICGENEHVCFHGSKCVSNDGVHACDCRTTDSTIADRFAGDSCEHLSTDICVDGDLLPGQTAGFCTNGGICIDYVKPGLPHPGCSCPPFWRGSHCEIYLGHGAPRGFANPEDDKNPGVVIFLALLFVGVLGGGYFMYRSMGRRQQRRNDIMTKTLAWASRYQDEKPEVNLAPRRSSSINEGYIEDVYLDSVRGNESAGVSFSTRQSFTAVESGGPAAPIDTSADLLDDGDSPPEIYLGPPTDEDGHELHNVDIL